MKFEPLEQRSDEWYLARLGKPTASQFHRIVTPSGRPSAMAPLYEAELIAERIFKRPMGKDISKIPAVAHGRETEDEAAQMLTDMIGPMGARIEPGGFFSDDHDRYGCSPDRQIVSGNKREIVEIKCPESIPRHVANLLFGADTDHRVQLQGQLWITGYDAVHFMSYHEDCPPHYERIGRDENFIKQMSYLIEKFCADLEDDYKRALKMGAWNT